MSILEVYKAMADESRLRLVHVLSSGYFNVQELTAILSLSQSTVSHHLKILQTSGIVQSHKEGTWTYHTLVPPQDTKAYSQIPRNFLDLAAAHNGDSSLKTLIEKDSQQINHLLDSRRQMSHSFFENIAGEWKQMRTEAQGTESFLEEIKSLIPDSVDLLDLGCGSGFLLEQLLPRNGHTVGVDYSQSMLDEAKANLNGKSENVDLRLGTLEHLPLGDHSIDIAIAYMVMHHIASPQGVIEETARVLKPGGTFLVVDLVRHNNEFMRERYADLWLGFDPHDFSLWFESAGFIPQETRFLGETHTAFLATALTKK